MTPFCLCMWLGLFDVIILFVEVKKRKVSKELELNIDQLASSWIFSEIYEYFRRFTSAPCCLRSEFGAMVLPMAPLQPIKRKFSFKVTTAKPRLRSLLPLCLLLLWMAPCQPDCLNEKGLSEISTTPLDMGTTDEEISVYSYSSCSLQLLISIHNSLYIGALLWLGQAITL